MMMKEVDAVAENIEMATSAHRQSVTNCDQYYKTFALTNNIVKDIIDIMTYLGNVSNFLLNKLVPLYLVQVCLLQAPPPPNLVANVEETYLLPTGGFHHRVIKLYLQEVFESIHCISVLSCHTKA